MIQDFQHIFANLSVFQWATFGTFLGFFCFRLLYLFLFTARLAFLKNKSHQSTKPQKLALVLTMRNEADNIRNKLQRLLQLEKNDFEVIAVDDFSQDETYSVLGLLKQRFSRLKISSLNQETRYSVKLAQNIALKSVENSWVLYIPISAHEFTEEWLHEFSVKAGEDDVNLLLGYSSILPQRKFYNLLYRIEGFLQQLQCIAYVRNGLPFVYNEENLAFKKESYFNNGGYAKKIREPYANLELIVNEFIKRKTTRIVFNKNTVLQKEFDADKLAFQDLLKKRKRIENNLSVPKQLMLWFTNITDILFLPVTVLALWAVFALWPLIVILLGIMILAHMFIIKISMNRLNERKIFIPSLVYVLLMPYFKIFFYWRFRKTTKEQQWRNRL